MPKIVKPTVASPVPSEKPEAVEVPPSAPEVTETPPDAEETPLALDTTLGNVKRRANKAAYMHDSTVVRHHADDYPTPRGFVEPLLEFLNLGREAVVLEPCAGGGHLVEVLREHFDDVRFDDLHYSGVDFLEVEPPRQHPMGYPGSDVDWIITNPPYKHAEAFIRHSLKHARGVAMLLNSAFLESVSRSQGLFKDYPPSEILMCNRRMRIDGGKSSVFAHVWVVWRQPNPLDVTTYHWLDVTGDKQMPTGHLESVWPEA